MYFYILYIFILFALDICSLQIFGYQKHLEAITPAWLFHDSSRFQTPDSAWAKAPVVDESSAATGSNGVAGLEVGQRWDKKSVKPMVMFIAWDTMRYIGDYWGSLGISWIYVDQWYIYIYVIIYIYIPDCDFWIPGSSHGAWVQTVLCSGWVVDRFNRSSAHTGHGTCDQGGV